MEPMEKLEEWRQKGNLDPLFYRVIKSFWKSSPPKEFVLIEFSIFLAELMLNGEFPQSKKETDLILSTYECLFFNGKPN